MQRTDFIKSLYDKVHRDTKKAISQYKQFVVKASNYVSDGLSHEECVELLILDGLNREAAKKYVNMAEDTAHESCLDITSGSHEYSFTFEDSNGKLWASNELGRTVRACNDGEAWMKVEKILDEEDLDAEIIVSVNRI